jgi:hypothetical protein
VCLTDQLLVKSGALIPVNLVTVGYKEFAEGNVANGEISLESEGRDIIVKLAADDGACVM